MIPTSDGSAARAFLGRIDPESAAVLSAVLQAAISKSAELATEAASLGAAQAAKLIDGLSDIQQAGIVKNAVRAVDENIAPIKNTALDAAIAVFASHPAQIKKLERTISGDAAAVVAGAAITGGLSAGAVRHDLHRAGSILGDAEAIASGNPQRIARRIGQHVFWRAFGRMGRSIFRGLENLR